MPEIEVENVPSTRAPSGTGEMGVRPIADAIYNTASISVRNTPIRPRDLQA